VTPLASTPTAVPAGADCVGYIRVSTEQQAGELAPLSPSSVELFRIERQRSVDVLDPAPSSSTPGSPVRRPRAGPRSWRCSRSAKRIRAPPRRRDPRAQRLTVRPLRRSGGSDALAVRAQAAGLGRAVRRGRRRRARARHAYVIRLIGSAQASEYRANLKRTARRASRATAAKGRWQNKAPIGYRRLATRTDGAQRVLEAGQRKSDDEVTRLTPGPSDEQEIVRFASRRTPPARRRCTASCASCGALAVEALVAGDAQRGAQEPGVRRRRRLVPAAARQGGGEEAPASARAKSGSSSATRIRRS
jgi:hypothetical protein